MEIKKCLNCKNEYTDLQGTNCPKCAGYNFKYVELKEPVLVVDVEESEIIPEIEHAASRKVHKRR